MKNQRLDERGHEILSDEEVVQRTRLKMPASQVLRMRAMIRQELSRQADEAGHETFEEADDFELPEGEGDWVSPYEELFDPPVVAAPPPSAEPPPAAPADPAPPTGAAPSVEGEASGSA